MRKYLKLRLRLNLVRHPRHTVLNVQFETEALRDWSLALCLLKEGLIEALLVGEEGTNRELEVRVLSEIKPHARAQASFETETTRLRITLSDLDYLRHFFLKYYRDGVGEVDHVDLEVASATESSDASITFKVPEAVLPLSAEEAKKRLGLD